jgi:hypothetical protein
MPANTDIRENSQPERYVTPLMAVLDGDRDNLPMAHRCRRLYPNTRAGNPS